ncbi:MAG: PKD domain-containing protein [candidate division WOR-3 bacterium]|uniref:PKD domain-containing protein n=1 Tax=candidate division WOR-3 bacterium TaxID=2052148 RepID=A0A7V4CHH7_UNCW3|nr:PKD domain-containing protein [Candidatus Omnitrophota bacterium]
MKKVVFFLFVIFIFFQCKKEKPPQPPTISGPTSGNTNRPITFSVVTTDPNKDEVAYLFNFGDGTQDSWSTYYASGQKVNKEHIYLKPGNYDISAKAKDIKGNESEWSPIHSILISSQPPNTPSIPQGPNSGTINTPYTFSSSATDPDNDSIAIRFDWGNGDTSNWSSYVRTGTTVIMSYSYPNEGTFNIRAQAKDIYGSMSEWSAPLTITIIRNRPPNIPSTPIGPSYGCTGELYTFSSSATDPDDDSISIRFDWGNGDTSDWSNYLPNGSQVYMDYFYLNEGTFNIRAQAKDIHGNISEWSLPHTITIISPVIMTEDFEGEFPGTKWTLYGTPTWDDENYRAHNGNWSGWCAGSTRTPSQGYAPNMNAWMIYGPFSLADASEAYLDFYYWLDSEEDYDYFFFGASIDGYYFYGYRYSGRERYWYYDWLDLSNVPTLGNLCGRPQVWIAFAFYSDASVQYEGAYVDDIVLTKYIGTSRYLRKPKPTIQHKISKTISSQKLEVYKK